MPPLPSHSPLTNPPFANFQFSDQVGAPSAEERGRRQPAHHHRVRRRKAREGLGVWLKGGAPCRTIPVTIKSHRLDLSRILFPCSPSCDPMGYRWIANDLAVLRERKVITQKEHIAIDRNLQVGSRAGTALVAGCWLLVVGCLVVVGVGCWLVVGWLGGSPLLPLRFLFPSLPRCLKRALCVCASLPHRSLMSSPPPRSFEQSLTGALLGVKKVQELILPFPYAQVWQQIG